jgi:hypothetical protein
LERREEGEEEEGGERCGLGVWKAVARERRERRREGRRTGERRRGGRGG